MTCYYCGTKSTPEALKHNICEKNVQGVEPDKIKTLKTPN